MVLPWLAAAWVVGLAAAPAFSFPEWQWVTLAGVAGLAAWATRREPRLGWAFLTVCFCFLGMLRATIAESRRATASITAHVRTAESVDLQGAVLSQPTGWGDSFAFDLQAQGIASPGQATGTSADGLVRVLSAAWLPARRGEVVVVRGRLRQPTRVEGMRSSAVLEAVSLRRLAPPPRLHPAVLLDEARDLIVERLHQVLPAGEASLVAGVLLGADEQMPEPVQEAFRATGTAHILAVSGFNVTIVAAAAATAFGRLLGARRGAIAAGAAVLTYTLLCGADAAVVRAAIMAGVALVALRIGRQSAALTSLAAAAILMGLLDPSVIFDVGFQLSFLATLGLVLAGRPSQEAIRGWAEKAIPHEGARSAAVLLGELAVLSLVAQAATLPLSAFLFHRLPLTSLPANALILPAQPLLMAAGAATAAASLLSVSLGQLMAWLAWPLAAYTIRVAEIFASLPGASLVVPPFPSGYMLLAYAALGALLLAGRWPRARATAASLVRVGGPAWLAGLAAVTTLTWLAAVERPDGRLHVTAFPGGEVLVESPTGRFLALSAGPSSISLRESLDGHLPLTSPSLDWLVLTHPQVSAEAALEALGRYGPPRILLSEAAGLDQELEGNVPVEVVRAKAGTRLALGDGARLEVIDPARGQAAFLITYRSAAIVIAEGERGSWGISSAASGASAVILLGDGRIVARSLRQAWWGLPPLALVAAPLPGDPFLDPRDGDSGSAPALATPSNGWVRLSTDGSGLEVRTERRP